MNMHQIIIDNRPEVLRLIDFFFSISFLAPKAAFVQALFMDFSRINRIRVASVIERINLRK